MNEQAIEEVVKQTRAAVEAAKGRGEREFDFSKFYLALPDISLDEREKGELMTRFATEGWRVENKVVLRF